MKNIFLIVIVNFIVFQGFSQDKIYKKDNTIIHCKVVEIGLNELKYYEESQKDGPLISIAVEVLSRVELGNGRVIEFKDPLSDPQSYTDDRKSALKVHFLSPMLEHLAFSYERSIKPGRSVETELGIIGLGFNTDPYSKSSGLFLSGGYKFMRTPDFYAQRYKYAHILKGSYIKPQLLLSIYNNKYEAYNFSSTPGTSYEKQNVVAGAFLINIGKQIVYDNLFLIDYSFGLGYGFSNLKDNNSFDTSRGWRANHYGFILGSRDAPIAMSFRIKVGMLLK